MLSKSDYIWFLSKHTDFGEKYVIIYDFSNIFILNLRQVYDLKIKLTSVFHKKWTEHSFVGRAKPQNQTAHNNRMNQSKKLKK